MEEFATTMAQKQKQRQDDEDRNNKILATMRKMIADEELEDRMKREKQVCMYVWHGMSVCMMYYYLYVVWVIIRVPKSC